MFYTQFLKLCKEKGVKPTPLIKQLGLSSGNLKKWADGGSVSSETLVKLSNYFDVPIDFFFEDDETELSSLNVIEEVNAFKVAFNAIKAHTDYIASMLTGSQLSAHDLSRISQYMNCSQDYLVKNKVIIDDTGDNSSDVHSPVFLISEILARMPGVDEYRHLQVRISMIITANLAKKDITMDDLLAVGLVEKKIRKLYDPSIPVEKKKGLNYSDVVNIARKCNVSIEFMLTGNGS